jgi:fibronectin-binding autotransporter adhesin
MTMRNPLISSLALTLATTGFAVSPAISHAATLYWDSNGATAGFGNTTGTWGTSNFWNDDSTGGLGTFTATTTSADTANFGTATLNYAQSTVSVAAGGVTIGNIVTGAAQTTNINLGTAGNSVTIHNGFTKNSTAGNFIFTTSPVVLAGSQTWTNNTPASTFTAEVESLRAQAGINYGANTFTIDGVGVTGFSGGAITGSGDFIKNGTGTVVFNAGTQDNSATFTGNIFLNGGVARFQNTNNMGSGNIAINGGILEGRFAQTLTRTQGAAAGQIQIIGGVSGFSGQGNSGTTFNIGNVTWGSATFNPSQFVFQSAVTNLNGKGIFQSAIDLGGATRTIRSDQSTVDFANGHGTFSGDISNGGITKTGTGHHIFSGTNTYGGGTTINQGILTFQRIAAMPSSGNVQVNDGGVLGIRVGGGGNWTNGTSGVGTLGGLLAGEGGAGTSTVSYSGNVGVLLDVNATTTYSGNIANVGTTLALYKMGTSALTLDGNNTYSGGTFLGQGTLNVNSATALGSGAVTFNGGNIDNTSGSAKTLTTNNVQAWNQNFTFTGTNDLNMGTGAVTINAARTVTVNGGKLTVGGDISGEFGLTKSGAGTLTLTGTGSTFGTNAVATVNINAGTLEVAKLSNRGVASSIGDANADYSLRIGNGATLRYIGTGDSTNYRLQYGGGGTTTIESSGSGALNFTSTVSMGSFAGGTNQTIILGGTNADNNTFSPLVSTNGVGVLSLTKQGTGKWILTNANTYTGATSITGGTLLINGSTDAASAFTVGANGTLGGTGTIGGTVAVTGTLSPGASIESLASGALTMNDGSTFVFEAVDNTDTGADVMIVSGALSLTNVTLDLSAANLDALTWLAGDKLTLISYTGTGITSGFAGYTDDTEYFFGINGWTLNYNDTVKGGNFALEVPDGVNYVTLTLTTIPEPGSLALLGLGGLMMLSRTRRA